MAQNTNRLPDDLPAPETSKRIRMLRPEVKQKPGKERRESKVTGEKAERNVMEDVQVKIERADDDSAEQTCSWLTPTGSGDCVGRDISPEKTCQDGHGGDLSKYIKQEPNSDDNEVEMDQERTGSSVCGNHSPFSRVSSGGQPDSDTRGVGSSRLESEEQPSTSAAHHSRSMSVEHTQGSSEGASADMEEEEEISRFGELGSLTKSVKPEMPDFDSLAVNSLGPRLVKEQVRTPTAERMSVFARQGPQGCSVPSASKASDQVPEMRYHVIQVAPDQLYLLPVWGSSAQCRNAVKAHRHESRSIAQHEPEEELEQDQSAKERRSRKSKIIVRSEAMEDPPQDQSVKENSLQAPADASCQEAEPFSCPCCNFKSRLKGQLILHAKMAHEGLKIQDFLPPDPTLPEEQAVMPPAVEKPPPKKKESGLPDQSKSCKKGFRFILPAEVVQGSSESKIALPSGSVLPRKKTSRVSSQHQQRKEFSCPRCDGKFPTEKHLRFHLKYDHVHVKEPKKRVRKKPEKKPLHQFPKTLPCPYCDFTARVNGAVQRHVRIVHEGIRTHSCPHCNYRAARKDTLKIHVMAVHERLRKFLCSQCGYKCTEKGTLGRHIASVHEGIRKHKCPHCQFKSSLKQQLTKHIQNVHEGLKMHLCQYCGATFGERLTLRRHIKAIHESSRQNDVPH